MNYLWPQGGECIGQTCQKVKESRRHDGCAGEDAGGVSRSLLGVVYDFALEQRLLQFSNLCLGKGWVVVEIQLR